MRFLDSAKIFIKSGDGGSGSSSFRHEKFIEFGGPDGGDGGRGGSVVARCDPDLNTLIDFRYRQHFKAQRGQGGMGKQRTGASGKDLVIRLPPGTQILADDEETVLADLTAPGQEVVLAKGGDGGFGNMRFKTSTNRAPRRADPGWPGEERWVWLKLKLLADVGLVGLPNAGKSTFLSVVSNAKPKIADYPFTTLEPRLGTLLIDDRALVVADIPGLIEGASEGKGLGDRFLGHIERCAVLIHLVDGTGEDPVAAWHTIRAELFSYGHGLAEKDEIVCLNKCDALEPERVQELVAALETATGRSVHAISGVARTGIEAVLREAEGLVRQARARAREAEALALPA